MHLYSESPTNSSCVSQYLQKQHEEMLAKAQEAADSNFFGADPELQSELNAAKSELLKSSKQIHELEKEGVKLQADVKDIQAEMERV